MSSLFENEVMLGSKVVHLKALFWRRDESVVVVVEGLMETKLDASSARIFAWDSV